MNSNRPNILLIVLILLLVIIFGLINVTIPFYGDQAFFMLGAKEMNEGLVLYRDFWDIKQPGVFFFYLLAGRIFGFTYIGIHLFELFYWLLFTIILIWYLNRFNFFKNIFLNYFTPLLIVGTYYSVNTLRTMTQVEILVNFPLMMVLIFNTFYLENKRNTNLWLFLSGIFGGIVLLFKIIFAPVLALLWLFIFLKEWNIKHLLIILFKSVIILAGIIVAWIPFAIYCFHYNILELCYNTFIQLPPLVLKYGQVKPADHLIHSAYSFFSKLVFIIPLLIYSLFFIRKKFIVNEMWGWLIAGTIVVLLQKNSWYTYHFQILYTPIVFLALTAVDAILSKLSFTSHLRTFWIGSVFFLICSVQMIYIGKKLIELSKFNFTLTANDRLDFAISQRDNALAYRIAGYLSDKKDNCPIFVVNDPLVYYYTNRNQSTAQSGWSMQLFIPGQLEILRRELVRTRPCYIFLRKEFDPFFYTKGSEILRWINQNYLKSYSSADGTWYKLI